MSFAAKRNYQIPDTLWHMSKDGHDAECVIERTPVGHQAGFLIDGRMLASYQFPSESLAVRWAVEKCADLGTRGWRMRFVPHHHQPLQMRTVA